MTELRSIIPFGRALPLRRGEFDPFAGFREEVDRLFDDLGTAFPAATARQGFMLPRADVAETDVGLELTADLPGFDDKDVTLDIHDGVLTVKAEHRDEREEKDEKKHFHLVERRHGAYLRRFALPFEADSEKASARLDKGVLKVSVPRMATPEKQPTRIKVTAK